MVSLGAVPLNSGFLGVCVQQDAHDDFFFFLKRKLLILFDGALIMWQIFVVFVFMLLQSQNPRKTFCYFLIEESRAGSSMAWGGSWNLMPPKYSSKLIFAKYMRCRAK